MFLLVFTLFRKAFSIICYKFPCYFGLFFALADPESFLVLPIPFISPVDEV